MAVAETGSQQDFAQFETLVAEYKVTLACCREAFSRLKAAEQELQEQAGRLGASTDALDLSGEIGGTLKAEIQKVGTTVELLHRLSERELLVFTLLGQGVATPEIALRLSIATSTVETYRERVKQKLGLASGTALVREAVLWVANRDREMLSADA
jgi:DNA-binding NarL/FixJ family response regulator